MSENENQDYIKIIEFILVTFSSPIALFDFICFLLVAQLPHNVFMQLFTLLMFR